ncbi:MAG: bifunctional phosphoglucose/phosphomannose isomerase, partial [Hymenobacteraceae bacterium]|nr:bifunctional phosphoglucose/phosphomannose isomerase [Hymenobacteraceae bacterium]
NAAAIKAQAKDVAESLLGKLPVLYASSVLEPVAVRSQQQLNENAKQICHVNAFSEMNHNEIVGWVNPEKILKEVTVVLLRSSYDHERVQKRMDLCKPIFQEKANDVLEVRAQGQSLLAQMFYFIHLFDWVSLYLADLNGVDPNPVKVIDHLKNALAKA